MLTNYSLEKQKRVVNGSQKSVGLYRRTESAVLEIHAATYTPDSATK